MRVKNIRKDSTKEHDSKKEAAAIYRSLVMKLQAERKKA